MYYIDDPKLFFNSGEEARKYFYSITGRNSFRRIIDNKKIEKDIKTGWNIYRINPRKWSIKKENK